MNIISNDCVAAYIYQNHLKTEFKNPFIWHSIDIENFSKLVESYDDIDFRNIKCELINNDTGICKKESLTPKIIIDNLIEVNYFHYIQDSNFKEPTKMSGYTFYNDIVEYATDLYNKRLLKMTESPVFIWDVTKIKWYNKEGNAPLDVFKSMSPKYNLIIYQPFITNGKDGNIILLRKTNSGFEVNVSAKYIYNNVLKQM